MIFFQFLSLKMRWAQYQLTRNVCSCLKMDNAYICNNLLKQFHETDQAWRYSVYFVFVIIFVSCILPITFHIVFFVISNKERKLSKRCVNKAKLSQILFRERSLVMFPA